MTDFHRLPADQQRLELVTLEQALIAKREVYRRQHGEEPTLTPRGRRHGDPDHEDHMHERDGGGNGIGMGYRGLGATATGPLGILALVFVLVGLAASYIAWDGFKGMRADAGEIKALIRQSSADHDLLACVVSLSPEERTRIRQTPTRDGFQMVCPWLRPTEGRR